MKAASRRQCLLLGITVLAVVGIHCARHSKRAAEPDPQIQRLANSAFGVLQTSGFSHAFATADCGPTDGPAVAVYLSDERSDSVPPTTRYIRVRIWYDANLLAQERFQWQESRGPGEAVLCSRGSCAAMKSGHVDFGAVKAGESVEGELDFLFTNGIRIRKRFHAGWRPNRFVCGLDARARSTSQRIVW
jgi:hypothetical protein